MRSIETSFLKPTPNMRNLLLLEEISRNPAVSQRKLSSHLGIALGLTNAYLKKMIRKGLVKAKGLNHKRISYYLAPNGISEKTKLTYHFLEYTVRYYSNLKDSISVTLSLLIKAGHKRIVCYGAGEVMEVTFVILNELKHQLLVVTIVDDDVNKHGQQMFGLSVTHPQSIKTLKPDAVLVTSIKYRERIIDNLRNNIGLSGISLYSL